MASVHKECGADIMWARRTRHESKPTRKWKHGVEDQDASSD